MRYIVRYCVLLYLEYYRATRRCSCAAGHSVSDSVPASGGGWAARGGGGLSGSRAGGVVGEGRQGAWAASVVRGGRHEVRDPQGPSRQADARLRGDESAGGADPRLLSPVSRIGVPPAPVAGGRGLGEERRSEREEGVR